jgi:hypothetical protein
MALALTLAVVVAAGPARAQNFAPFADFARLKEAQLANLQVKVTWIGTQDEMLPSVGFTARGKTFDLSQFAAFHRPGINYGNDVMPLQTFTASTHDLAAMLAGVGALGAITSGAAAPNGVLSFALNNGGAVFEAIPARADATALLAAIMSALHTNADAQRVLGDLGCAGGVLPASSATDVSSSVSVTRSGIRLNRATGRYVQAITLANTSGARVAGPVSVILQGLAGSITVANKNGTTCNIAPTGLPFVNAPGSLAAGAKVNVPVEFDNPDALQVNYSTRVFAGEGSR